jgi:hypothetical protein
MRLTRCEASISLAFFGKMADNARALEEPMFWLFVVLLIPWIGYLVAKATGTFTGDDSSWRDLKKVQELDQMLATMTQEQRREVLDRL